MIRAALVITLLVSAAYGSAVSGRADSQCSQAFLAQTKSCLDAYFSGYGLNPAKLPPFTDYVAKIVDLTTHFGANGVDIFCSYEVTVENCLDYLFNSPCMSAASFQDMYNMNLSDAIEYSTDFPVRAYMCNNKQFMKDNLACFDNVVVSHMDDRRKCSTAVETAIKNVKDGDYCSPWGDFVTCTDDVYVKYCGPQVKGYICNVVEVGINFDSQGACKSVLPKCFAN